MLLTMERRRARSTYSSASWCPSCTARRVSVTPALTTIRFPTAVLDPGVCIPAVTQRLLELPHPYREQEPKPHERDDHGGPPVAHQRERDPHHGKQPRHHPQIDQRLGGEERGHAEGDDAPPGLPRAGRDLEPPEHQEPVRQEQDEAPHEPPHLGEHGEDEIRMALREEGEAALRRAADALAQALAGPDGDLGLDHVVRRSEWIAERVQIDEQSLPLIRLEREPRERRGG